MIFSRNDFRYIILVVLVPIIGIASMFSYSYIYVNKEIAVIKNELSGLKALNALQDIIFDVQKLRGLSSIKNKNGLSDLKIKKLQKKITTKVSFLKVYIQSTQIYSNKEENILLFLNTINKNIYNNIDFEYLTAKIEQALLLLKDIAYDSSLILDSKGKSYILIDTIVSILPEIIEYNGQIRGISSALNNYALAQTQKENIKILLSKIDEKLYKFNHYMLKIEHTDIQNSYIDMMKAQKLLVIFANRELLYENIITINPNIIFKLETENIEYIINIYNKISERLKHILQKRVADKKQIMNWIILVAFASLVFILYINLWYYSNNKKFIKKIKQLSVTDSMTDLFNRREFDEKFIKSIKRAKREKKYLVLMMLDIDYFKNYNDNYGHQQGDTALKSVAKTILSSFSRPDDTVYRLGGEEFGVLFLTNNKDGARAMAQKVLTNIENLNIEHSFSCIANHITASIGIGIISSANIENNDTIYVKVDNALYRAKEKGRNRCELVSI